MSDTNRLSITGDSTRRVWVNSILVFNEDDTIADSAHLVAEQYGIMYTVTNGWRELHIPTIIARKGDSDLIKCSGLDKVRVVVGTVDGREAKEDAIDINHCKQVEVYVNHLWPGKTYCGTIKGASRGIHIMVQNQHGHGGQTDWDYGNFSDQGNGKTTDCSLDVTTEDDSAVRVRLLSADPVTYLNQEEEDQHYITYKVNQGWFYPIYNFLKDLLRSFSIKI